MRKLGCGCNSRLHSGPLVARRKRANSLKLDFLMQIGWRTAAALDHRDLTRTLRLALWGRFGNKMGTGLATSAQCRCNVNASGRCRNYLAIKPFKYQRNVFSIPRLWQTSRTQNPVCDTRNAVLAGYRIIPTIGVPFCQCRRKGSASARRAKWALRER